jgi:hypothetical protein
VALGYRVYPVHPRSSKSYRTRKLPSGTKTDRRDCWALADALRLEGESWRVLTTPEPLVQQLRLLCRDEVTLIEQRTALINQLQQALYEYYPAALEAFEDWCAPSAWAFVECFPTPQTLVLAGKRKWQNFLHAHKLFHPELNPHHRVLQATSRSRPLHFTARGRTEAGSPAVGRAGCLEAAGGHAASFAVSGGHGSGQLSIGQGVRRLSAPPMQPVLAPHRSLVGGFEPALLRLGAHLLRSPPEKRPEPRLRVALPGNALAQNHRGHDPQPDAV